MILDRVTITGADESVDRFDLYALSKQYPFVEWGILVGSHYGARFPGQEWQRAFAGGIGRLLNVSIHLCGRHVRDFMATGQPGRFVDKVLWGTAQRVQLNFHGELQGEVRDAVDEGMSASGKSWIWQCDGVNNFPALTTDVSPLFDTSGGAGIVPQSWPWAIPGKYCGYAGGLGPENVFDEVVGRIREAAQYERIWIDMERKVRSADDSWFDIDRVEQVLKAVSPLVVR